MNRSGYGPIRRTKDLSAVLGQSKLRAQDCLCGGRAETNNDSGTNDRNFLVQPRAASRDFKRVRLFMQPDFPPRFPFKVLNRVRNVNRGTIDAGHFEASIKQLTSRPHEWPPQLILPITRLFTYEKDRGMRFSLAEHYLRRMVVKVTSMAMRGRLSQSSEIVARRHELQG
jgi:hypothetical protein